MQHKQSKKTFSFFAEISRMSDAPTSQLCHAAALNLYYEMPTNKTKVSITNFEG
jgi:hypothetical protein